MEQVLAFPPAVQSSAVGTFKVVVLYEDFATGLRGKQIADFVLEEMGQRAETGPVLWNVGLIAEPRICALVTEQAEDAELVILSLRDGVGYSIALRAWVNNWLEKRSATQAALIAVFENAGPATDFARRHLENAARRGRLEFLTQTVNLTEGKPEGQTELFWVM